MLLWLLTTQTAADEPVSDWSDLAVLIGLSEQVSKTIDSKSILQTGPTAGVAWHRSSFRVDLSYAHNNNIALGDDNSGTFSTNALSASISPTLYNRMGHPVAYYGGGAALVAYRAQITESRWNGWSMDHDELQRTIALHALFAWRIVHRESFAVELCYTQRYNFLNNEVIGKRHRILSLNLWLRPEDL